jgi:hypothetical protein
MITHWGTWDGRTIEFNRLTWQHLSNIHYYMNLTFPSAYSKSEKNEIRDTLYLRFGRILPYHPDPTFAFEKLQLVRLGYFRNNGDIVVDGHKIGWYE